MGVICGYTNAGGGLKNKMYVAQSNDTKYQDFSIQCNSYSCSIHLISFIHLLMTY